MPPKKKGKEVEKKKIGTQPGGLEKLKSDIKKAKSQETRKKKKEIAEAEKQEYFQQYLPKSKQRREERLRKQRQKIDELMIEAEDEIQFLREYLRREDKVSFLKETLDSWSKVDYSLDSKLRRIRYYKKAFIVMFASFKKDDRDDFASRYIRQVDENAKPSLPRRALDKYNFDRERDLARRGKRDFSSKFPDMFIRDGNEMVVNVPSPDKLSQIYGYDRDNLFKAIFLKTGRKIYLRDDLAPYGESAKDFRTREEYMRVLLGMFPQQTTFRVPLFELISVESLKEVPEERKFQAKYSLDFKKEDNEYLITVPDFKHFPKLDDYDLYNLVKAANSIAPIDITILSSDTKKDKIDKLVKILQPRLIRNTFRVKYFKLLSPEKEERKEEDDEKEIRETLIRIEDERKREIEDLSQKVDPRLQAQIKALYGDEGLQKYLEKRARNRLLMLDTSRQKSQLEKMRKKNEVIIKIAQKYKLDPSYLAYEVDNNTTDEKIGSVISDLLEKKMDVEAETWYMDISQLIKARDEVLELLGDLGDIKQYAGGEEESPLEEIEFDDEPSKGDKEAMDEIEFDADDEKEGGKVIEEVAMEYGDKRDKTMDVRDIGGDEEEEGANLGGLFGEEKSTSVGNLEDVEDMDESKMEAETEEEPRLFEVAEPDDDGKEVTTRDQPEETKFILSETSGRKFRVEAGDVREDERASDFQGIIIPETLSSYSEAQSWIDLHPESQLDLVNTWKRRPWMRNKNYTETVIKSPLKRFMALYRNTGYDKYLQRRGWSRPSDLFWTVRLDPSVKSGFEMQGPNKGRFFIEANVEYATADKKPLVQYRRLYFDIGLVVQPSHIKGEIKMEYPRGSRWKGRKRKSASAEPDSLRILPVGKIVNGQSFPHNWEEQPSGRWEPMSLEIKNLLSRYRYTLDEDELKINAGDTTYLFKVKNVSRTLPAKRVRKTAEETTCSIAWMKRPWLEDIVRQPGVGSSGVRTLIKTRDGKYISTPYTDANIRQEENFFIPSVKFWTLRCDPETKLSFLDDGQIRLTNPLLGEGIFRIFFLRSDGILFPETPQTIADGNRWIESQKIGKMGYRKEDIKLEDDRVERFLDRDITTFIRPYSSGPARIFLDGKITQVREGKPLSPDEKGIPPDVIQEYNERVRKYTERQYEYHQRLAQYNSLDDKEKAKGVITPPTFTETWPKMSTLIIKGVRRFVRTIPTEEQLLVRQTLVDYLISAGCPRDTTVAFEEFLFSQPDMTVRKYIDKFLRVGELLQPPLKDYARKLNNDIKTIHGEALAQMDTFPELKVIDKSVTLSSGVEEKKEVLSDLFTSRFNSYIADLVKRTASKILRWETRTSKVPFLPRPEFSDSSLQRKMLEERNNILRALMRDYSQIKLSQIGSTVKPEDFEKFIYESVSLADPFNYVYKVLMYLDPIDNKDKAPIYIRQLRSAIPRVSDPYLGDLTLFLRENKPAGAMTSTEIERLRGKKMILHKDIIASGKKLFKKANFILDKVNNRLDETPLETLLQDILKGPPETKDDDVLGPPKPVIPRDFTVREPSLYPSLPEREIQPRVVSREELEAKRKRVEEIDISKLVEDINNLKIEDASLEDLLASLSLSVDKWSGS